MDIEKNSIQTQYLDDIFSKLNTKKQKKKSIDPTQRLNEILNQKSIISKENLYEKIGEESSKGIEIFKNLLNDDAKYIQKCENKNFLMEKYSKKLDFSKIKSQEDKPKMKENLQKQLKFFDIPEHTAIYSLYVPLNKLWLQYVSEMLDSCRNQEELSLKFLKCDFHGAVLKVLESNCISCEGVQGIIIQETMRAFRIITEQNKLLTILKQNCIFLIQLNDKQHLKLFGCHLLQRPSHRIKTKFKHKNASEFILQRTLI